MRKALFGLLAVAGVTTIFACSSDPDTGTTATPQDNGDVDSGNSEPSQDTGAQDAGAQDGDTPIDGACTPYTPDASSVDGSILGLPTVDVPVSAPLNTPGPEQTTPTDHYPKQIGVLSAPIGDASSVVHVLAPMGLPYALTSSPVLAIQHDMSIFFPEVPENTFAPGTSTENLFRQYVNGGGVVVAKVSDDAVVKELGGIASSTFKLEHHWFKLTDAGKARFPSLDQEREQEIPLGGDTVDYLNTWVLNVDTNATGVTVLATFEDGKPAMVERKVGSGYVYTMGVDYRDVVQRNQLGHSLAASARGYVNTFEPATDTWMLMIRDIYDARVRFGVRLHSAPKGLSGTVLLSHDLDWGPSYDNAIEFATDEKNQGASATYFIHTKYVSDWQDSAFFDASRGAQLAKLLSLGGRVGSHSVAHSPVLHTFPVGDGNETYPSYAPYNVSLNETNGATMFGELRVSKSLIDGALGAQCVAHEVTAFRAGNLEYNMAAPQTMERVGYRVDSTRAIGDVMGAFPFRAMTDWPDALDTSVFEIPVNLEDQASPRLDDRVADSLAIIRANADNGAPTVILIHPNIRDWKANAQTAIVTGLPSDIKAMSIDEFADFWRARDAARVTKIDYDDSTKKLTVVLATPIAVDGLTVRVASNVTAVSQPAGLSLAAAASGKFVVLPHLDAGATTTLAFTYQ